MAPKLLPCPFCGGEAKYWPAYDSYNHYIECYPCSVRIGEPCAHKIPNVIEKWNSRAAQPLPAPTQHAVRPSGEQLYTMVTSRFSGGSLPWTMVSRSGKLAWEAAASDLLFEPDTVMARFGNASFEEAVEEIKSLDGWEYADREALWKLFYEKGMASKNN